MKANMPSKPSLDVISNWSTPPLHAILYANLKCNTLFQKNGNLNRHALTSMQTKNEIKKHETTLLSYLDKASLFKVKKVREGKGNKI